MTELSGTTEKVLNAIATYWSENNLPPSLRDVSALAGVSLTSVPNYHMVILEDAGMISRQPLKSRTILVTEAGRDYLTRRGRTGPVPANPGMAWH